MMARQVECRSCGKPLAYLVNDADIDESLPQRVLDAIDQQLDEHRKVDACPADPAESWGMDVNDVNYPDPLNAPTIDVQA